MSDILYTLSMSNNLVVVSKKDYFLVAINVGGVVLHPLMALEQIEISTVGEINSIISVKLYPEGKYTPDKRAADTRDLFEVQNAQLALEIELTIELLTRSFPLSEIADVFLPARMIAEVLKHQADFDLPGVDFPRLAEALVQHADYMIRTGLNDSGIQLPELTFEVDATSSANTAVPAVRLVLDWLQQTLDGFSGIVSKMALRRAESLRAGQLSQFGEVLINTCGIPKIDSTD